MLGYRLPFALLPGFFSAASLFSPSSLFFPEVSYFFVFSVEPGRGLLALSLFGLFLCSYRQGRSIFSRPAARGESKSGRPSRDDGETRDSLQQPMPAYPRGRKTGGEETSIHSLDVTPGRVFIALTNLVIHRNIKYQSRK
ncbi:uncharacterized protein ARB_05390 [Trichophyton benhamiae CBS 112371]|uniref:Transmembrane protein n=1 Tax=Arthroderma benhamiae (strain ATCC MYA-4681 / CBS 112371) TaxID=663331 RepID=D4AMD7_ARTBC|nr:uncharacterized protein ARB_05390 [Trichophyton benhamiae CBS 112371]EFE35348.1 hypothetical protein ARB_05390 [Trichophyton benhamiae CBS 112371]